MMGELIAWPDRNDYPRIAADIAERAGFPGVIGAVDGTYV